MLPSAGTLSIVLVLGLLGTYYAATSGVLMAMGSQHVPEALRGSGLALLGTAVSVSNLLASVIFGALWSVLGIQTAVAIFAAALVAAMALAVRGLRITAATA
jgi:MFS family permease